MLYGLWPNEDPPIWEHRNADGTYTAYPGYRASPPKTPVAREVEDIASVVRLLCEAMRYINIAGSFAAVMSKFLLKGSDSPPERDTTIRVGMFKMAIETFFRALPDNNPNVYTEDWFKIYPEVESIYLRYQGIRNKHVAHRPDARNRKDKIVYHRTKIAKFAGPVDMIYVELNSDLILIPTTPQIDELRGLIISAIEFGEVLLYYLTVEAFAALDAA